MKFQRSHFTVRPSATFVIIPVIDDTVPLGRRAMHSYRTIGLILGALLSTACAGSATHDVVSAYQADDGNLTCSEIKTEMMKAQLVIDGVNKDKEDWTAADITDGLLWFPFNLIAKDSNYREALAAGNSRIARLTTLEKEKNCLSNADAASGDGLPKPAARQERQLFGPEIVEAYAGNTFDAFQSENDRLSGDVHIVFDAGGTMSGQNTKGNSDTGDWWLEGEHLCRKWENWESSDRECFKIMLLGNRIRWIAADGRIQGVFRSRKFPLLKGSTEPTVYSNSPTKDETIETRLRKLNKLVKDGLLSEEEAASKRKEIIKGL